MRRISLLLSGLMLISGIFAQSAEEMPFTKTDTIPSEPILFTSESAYRYILDLLEMDELWNKDKDSMRLSLGRLIDHFNEPIDSVESRLLGFDYDSVSFKKVDIVQNDTIPFLWLNDSTLIIDSPELIKKPFVREKTIINKIVDTTFIVVKDSVYWPVIPADTVIVANDTLSRREDYVPEEQDTLKQKRKIVLVEQDTITELYIDTVFLEKNNIRIYRMADGNIIPPIIPPGSGKSVLFLPDSSGVIITDTIRALVGERDSPFNIVPGENLPDSLRMAVKTLISHTEKRDSILVFFNDIYGQETPFWLTTSEDDLYRYWVKNYNNDSITVWMGNPSKHVITMTLEKDVNLNRLTKEVIDDIPINIFEPELSLAKVEPLEEIPIYWNYSFGSSFILNQTFLSNWSKGGENSFSSLLDIEGTAEYTDEETETQWTNSGRLKYGTIITEEHGLRTNTDMLEFNSKYNKVIKEKIDFSSVFYMKSQVAKGFNYPNDSIVVSKFLNPGTFTIGVGLEYKPFKKTSLNFSPLSYKNTFVLDTANIDQTIHGVEADKRSRQEMGGQLVIKNRLNIIEDLSISNSVRLFSGYMNKPQNIDVDWEINFDKRINWYFKVLLNLHLIYDDDILFPVLDDDDQPVLLPDGNAKKVPKMQFKQFLGLTFSFRF